MHHVPGALVLHCQFCGTEAPAPQHAPAPQAPAPRIVVVQRPLQVNIPATPAPTLRWMPALIFFMCMPGIVGAIVAAVARGKIGSIGPTFKSTIGAALSAATNARFLDNGPQAIAADVNGDGVEDVIGGVADYAKGADEQYIAAIDGRTQEELWRSAKIGEPWSAHTVLSGKRLLIVETGGKATLLDAQTGRVKFNFSLSDKLERACVDHDEGDRFVLLLDDKTIVAVDPKTGVAKPATWPTSCGVDKENPFSVGRFRPRATNLQASDAHVEVKGTYISRVLSDGAASVGIAYKSPGSSHPRLVGIDLKAKAATWQVDLQAGGKPAKDGAPDVADVVDGRLYILATQRSGSPPKSFLEAIDGATGNTIWSGEIDSTQPGLDASSIVVGNSRVYVARAGTLQIFARKDGHPIGIIGPK